MDNQGFDDKPHDQSSAEPLPRYSNVIAASINIEQPQIAENKQNCCSGLERIQPQLNATFGGSLLMVISGMHIGWSIWRSDFSAHKDISCRQVSSQTLTFTLISWNITAILGGLVGSYVLQWQKKKIVYCSCASILGMSSLLLLIWNYEFAAVITARLMAGFAHGIVYTVLITHAGEVSSPEYRGRVLAKVNLLTTLGVFVFAVTHYGYGNSHEFYAERLFGIIALIISLISLVLSSIFTLESPVYLIQNELEQKARETMLRLRGKVEETESVRHEFEELQKMVTEESAQDGNVFSNGNVVPLLLICGLYLIGFLVNNWALNNIQMRLVQSIVRSLHRRASPAILTSIRFFAAILSTCLNDVFRRRLLLSLSVGLTTVALFIFGALLLTLNSSMLYVLLGFIIFHQVSVYGIEPARHILLSEAFPLKKKRWAITFASALDHALHIAVIVAFVGIGSNELFLYGITFATAGLMLSIGAVIHFGLPETSGLSLRQASHAFREVQ